MYTKFNTVLFYLASIKQEAFLDQVIKQIGTIVGAE